MESARDQRETEYDQAAKEMETLLEELYGCYDFDFSGLRGTLGGFQGALQSLPKLREARNNKRAEIRQTQDDPLKVEERKLVAARIRQLLGWDC